MGAPLQERVAGEHRWSGWPGSWCQDCHAEDQREVCLAVHDFTPVCSNGHEWCGVAEPFCGAPILRCPIHVNPPCPAAQGERAGSDQ